ncbi:MAG: GatB/YqeY domain-containing protein [Flavobacteriales bacterium]|nr:GatB/YqeY domain-containing protein [Flavobacteriales bacterium]
MTPSEKINNDIKQAMLAKDSVKLAALRAIKSAILLAQTSGKNAEIGEDDFLAIINKMVKQRQDSITVYEQQNRPDLAEEEKLQLDVIKQFLPAQLSDEELESAVKEILQKIGANSPADFGKAMGAASKELSGKADNKRVSQIIKTILG